MGINLFIAVTGGGWFEMLRRQPDLSRDRKGGGLDTEGGLRMSNGRKSTNDASR